MEKNKNVLYITLFILNYKPFDFSKYIVFTIYI
jgi:hypothetical protein